MRARLSFTSARLCALLFPVILSPVMLSTIAFAQQSAIPQSPAQQTSPAAPRTLIAQPIDESQLTVLKGNTHPLARPEFDLGTAPATLSMQRMLLVLKRSPEQESALKQLLDDQQDKSSPSYHKWLTPEDFGKQFGPADADIQTITAWLQAHGFQVGSTKGRTVLEFSGSASQVQEAFHTTIHKYIVNEQQHWANSNDPQIPAALTPLVAGVASLNNFPRKPMSVSAGKFTREKATGKITPIQPEFTFPSFPSICTENNSSNNPCFYGLGPYDFATIYDVLPLWNSGINGTGQTIAIVGETNINIQDVRDFRSLFGLPPNDPQIILNGPDPGIQGDESEADIDVQWSGAVASGATIDFVVSQSTETTAGTDLSAVYIVENNLAPVMSESYGFCELGLGTTGNQFYNALWQQAAAQGITVFISAGDNGAAGCDDFNAQSPAPAQFGLQVSGFASTPYNVAVGGTDFNDFSNPSIYWNTANSSTTQASAKSYIPETTWNDSCTNSIFGTVGFSTNAETNCNDPRLTPSFVVPEGGSGGASNCTTPNGSAPANCSGGYAKPSWQTGTGVPNDGKRDLPDVSLFASNGFLGNFYIICQSDVAGPCSLQYPYSNFLGFGGTSVSSPAFAGIMALVNQQMAAQGLSARQGNANYVLYKLAAQHPTAFHDVTSGTIAMPCLTGTPNCTTTNSADQYGVMTGYSAGVGYDLATGLGSVDAQNLVTNWSTVVSLGSTTVLNTLTPTTITHGQPVSFSVTVTPKTGTGTPTGTVSLLGGPTNSTHGIAGFNLSSGTFSGSTDLLPGGTYSVTAHYPGDATYEASDSSPISVTVNKENSQPQVFLVTFDSNGNIISSNTTTAVYGSPYLLRVNVENSAGQLCSPVASSAATGCPSGQVTLTNNGNPLDLGTYPLNTYGYFEDQLVQLPGGTDSIKAAYAGDSSFAASSVTSPLIILRASTGVNPPYLQNSSVGSPLVASAMVQSLSSGVPPTGTVTFFANGTPLTGTATYQGGNQIGPPAVAWLTVNFTSSTSAFTTPGNYQITATYNGDVNYSTSTSVAASITVLYPTPNVIVTPAQQTISYGNKATITALVDTTNKSTYPTGTVTFVDPYTGATVAGPTQCTNAKDANGNFACQAAATFTVTSSDPVSSNYSGDANYPLSNTWAFINMPDFSILPQSGVSITAGQSQSTTITFQSTNGLSGTLSNLACSGLPAESTCTFSPQQVTLPSNGNVSTTLTITTTAIGQSSQRAGFSDRRASRWGISEAMLLLAACFLGIPLTRRRGRISVLLGLVALFIVLPGCGGGSGVGGGGGGGGGTPNPVPSISSLSPTQIAAGSQIQNLYINGSNFIGTSTVTYNGTLHNSSLQSTTQLQIALGPADVATTGQFPVVVTNPSPGGGSSAPVNFSIMTGTPTGTFYITLTATTGPLTHTTTLFMSVQ
jgi:pro-kumamolisin-like protein/Big-like domain-containing protein